jgi:mono/diheme cytochrome c family protein
LESVLFRRERKAMNESEKQNYLEEYRLEKEKGLPFFPDILFKDAVVVLAVFLLLVALAYFIGAPLEAPANPADTNYTPRPEWYFLFLFQLLKKFPGNLEVVGVVLLPTIAIILLFLLPLLDRSPKRHPADRPIVVGVVSLVVLGIVYLTVQSYRETPLPTDVAGGDQTAALYVKNCAPCHGATMQVPAGTDLHDVIAKGKHEGMPSWSSDLTSDQIDALAGFISSPVGSQVFTQNCGICHQASELVAGNPAELKNAVAQGTSYAPHASVAIPQWDQVMSPEQSTSLLNFLMAPDGQRLFETNCSTCHGRTLAFSGTPSELRTSIIKGGMHREMPAWKEKLSDSELNSLANYVYGPILAPGGKALFDKYCSDCHGERVPRATTLEKARQAILSGGSHQTMPAWGNILTPEQIDALVSFILAPGDGKSPETGQKLFGQNCSPCHGEVGEGGPNPTRAGDIIMPISSSEYLKTRDDFTLRAIISEGQPNFGMSPFANSNGGPLDDEQIDAIVTYIRSWEANPPVELPPEISAIQGTLGGADIFKQLCAQCHGPNGEGAIGPALNDPQFQASATDQNIFDTINQGHPSTAMIGWGEMLTSEQITDLVKFIRGLAPGQEGPGPTPTAGAVTFTNDVLPIFQSKCIACHGNMGGWDSSSYEAVMTTGNNAPAIVPGDPQGSLLAQKLLGTQATGGIMPPSGKLSDDEIQLILTWIESGASEK